MMTRFMDQRGALFGLDARIALAIFSILSVVAGVAVVTNVDGTRAQALATELADTTQAIESYHNDLKTDIFLSLMSPNGKNAYQALYDSAVISEGNNLRARWNGPYIRFATNQNSRYGAMSMIKAGPNHSQPCNAEDICYLYIIYNTVKPGIAIETNKILDGEGEANPDKSGRLQWDPQDSNSVILYYRAIRALSQTMDY
ncbi:MAG: hypothetical protein DI585_04990 [Pseudomonas fluorescens]|nr:MAG: hypothetical protein DI585_04990 [Pseudomonas fluorescens]